MRRRAMRVPACVLVGVVIGLMGAGGCVVVHESGRSEGWTYREGSELRLEVRAGTPVPEGVRWVVGEWEGKGSFAQPPVYSQRYYVLEVRGAGLEGGWGGGRRSEVRSVAEIEGLPAKEREFDDRTVVMRLRRDAGVLVLEGEKEGKEASGRVLLEPDGDFAAVMRALAGREVEAAEMAALAYANVKRDDVEALRASGLTMSAAEVIRLRDRGVSGDYVRGMAAAGRSFSVDELVRLRDAGVSDEYVAELAHVGVQPSASELVRLRHNGVSAAFVQGLRGDSDAAPLPALDEIIRLRNSGVSARYITDLRAAGYDLSTGEVIKLYHASVSAAYAKGLREAGYDLGVDELIRLRNSGVSLKYVQDLQEPGYEPLSVRQIIDARNKGLSAEFVKDLRRRE